MSTLFGGGSSVSLINKGYADMDIPRLFHIIVNNKHIHSLKVNIKSKGSNKNNGLEKCETRRLYSSNV